MRKNKSLKKIALVIGACSASAGTAIIATQMINDRIVKHNSNAKSNDNTSGNSQTTENRLGSQHIERDPDNVRDQRWNFATGLIGGTSSNALSPQDGTYNRRYGNAGSSTPDSFMFCYNNTWYDQIPESYFPGAGGKAGKQPSNPESPSVTDPNWGIPIVISRVDGGNWTAKDASGHSLGLDFKANLNSNIFTEAHPGIFRDKDGDTGRSIEGNYDQGSRIDNVPAGNYYYVFAIGDKKAAAGVSQTAFCGDFGNNVVGEISLPETCRIIGNYAFAGCKANDRTSTLTVPENINYIGEYAFQNCYFWDINFKNDNISEVKEMEFSGNKIQEINKPWNPNLVSSSTGRGYVWFPYNPKVHEETDSSGTFKVTDLMKAYHDQPNFGFKYEDMKNGAKIGKAILTGPESLMVTDEGEVTADLGKIDPANPNNEITWQSPNAAVEFSTDGSTWTKTLKTKAAYADAEATGSCTSTVKVRSSKDGNLDINALTTDNHGETFTATHNINFSYDSIVTYEFDPASVAHIETLPDAVGSQEFIINEAGSIADKEAYVQGGSVEVTLADGKPLPEGLSYEAKTTRVEKGKHKFNISWKNASLPIGTYNLKLTSTSYAKDSSGYAKETTHYVTFVNDYEPITDFTLTPETATIDVIPGEASSTNKFTATIKSLTGKNKPGVAYTIEDFKKEGSPIPIPNWVRLSPSHPTTPDSGTTNDYSTNVAIDRTAAEGNYTFNLVAVADGKDATGNNPRKVSAVSINVKWEDITSFKFTGDTDLAMNAGTSKDFTEYYVEITSKSGKFKPGIKTYEAVNFKREGTSWPEGEKLVTFIKSTEEAITGGTKYRFILSIAGKKDAIELKQGKYTFDLHVAANGTGATSEETKNINLDVSYHPATDMKLYNVPTTINATYQQPVGSRNFYAVVEPSSTASQDTKWELTIPTEYESLFKDKLTLNKSVLAVNNYYVMLAGTTQDPTLNIPVGTYAGFTLTATSNDQTITKTIQFTINIAWAPVTTISISGKNSLTGSAKTASTAKESYQAIVTPTNACQEVQKWQVTSLTKDGEEIPYSESSVVQLSSDSTVAAKNAAGLWWTDAIEQGTYVIKFRALTVGVSGSGQSIWSGEFTVGINITYNDPSQIIVTQNENSLTMYANETREAKPFSAKVDPDKPSGWSDDRVKWSIEEILYNDKPYTSDSIKIDEDTGRLTFTDSLPYQGGYPSIKPIKIKVRATSIAKIGLYAVSSGYFEVNVKPARPGSINATIKDTDVYKTSYDTADSHDFQATAKVLDEKGSAQNTIQSVKWSIAYILVDGKRTVLDWMSIDEDTGVLSWTNEITPGNYQVYAKATSIYASTEFGTEVSGVITQPMSIGVEWKKPEGIKISAGDETGQGSEGKAGKLNYKFAVEVQGGKYVDPNVRWSIVMADDSNAKPDWLSIDDEGQVSWTADAVEGEYVFRIKATSVNFSDITGLSPQDVHLTIVKEDSLMWLWILISVVAVVGVGAGIGAYVGIKNKKKNQKEVAKLNTPTNNA